ncbi:mandelate racemase/muconate lactonizing enzyme family protein [Sphingobium nicotianae]|uniref:Mandelate racemase/muconate lactonizing enzyme family protein n=1 Tax=Sphingobium nicotianae TaxID=2782607 RepID=A0A9X1IPF5_9SPHN|nr:mandelate racemase/muconate lactonizing enzyme family protein [Sphingobium nicotianae]MBT2186072.1 mandelate racemase/muconate lactonizing enzyme family protein [Sphingobium nicotianae]
MRILALKSFHADGGWRPFSFLKITTDEGLVGWSEYSLGIWAPALPEVIEALESLVVGSDPRSFRKITAALQANTRFAAGGLNQQAISAIENACIDIAAKAANVPVHALFGGPIREEVDLYWSHCGSFRARDRDYFEKTLGLPPLMDLKDVAPLAEEVVARGYKAAKINPIHFTAAGPRLLNPGFAPGVDLARRLDGASLAAIEAQLATFTEALAGRSEAMLDLNFGFSTNGFIQICRHVAHLPLRWLEIDSHDPADLAQIRRNTQTPLASLEAVYGRSAFAPFLRYKAADVAIIDLLWNGMGEAVRMADLADLHGVNVAPHNFYGPLADLMAANFGASVPNFEIMEFEGDDVPWKYELLSQPIGVRRGVMPVPKGVGWGADIDEHAIAEYPWPRR